MSSSYNINLLPARYILPDGTFYGEYLYWDTDTNSWTVGSTTINLGKDAGKTSVANTIVLNASDVSLNAEGSYRFYVKPIRGISDTSGLTVMTYDEITGEITHTDISNLIFDDSGNLNMNCNIIVDVSDITFCDGTSYIEKQQQQDISINILDQQQIYQFSTGLYDGGIVSINSLDNTKFDISAGVGMISDGSNINTIVQWNDITGISVNNITTTNFSHIYMDKGGVVVQIQDISPTPENRRQYIYLAKLIHDGSFIEIAFNNPELIKDGLTNFYDYFDNISNFIVMRGGIITPHSNGTDLSLNFSEAEIYRSGINYINNKENPNIRTLPNRDAFDFTYRLVDISNSVENATGLDPIYYEDISGTTGVKTPVPNNKFTNQRIFLFPSGNISAQYGQQLYDKLEDAVNGVRNDTIILNKNIEDNGVLLCVISIKKEATDLNDSTKVIFTQADQFGRIGLGGGGAGGSVTSLQTAYDNETDGSITLNISGTKPFGIKNSSGVSILNVNNDNTIDISGDVEISGNLDLNCNLLNDVSGINFCDGTYIGHGASFDILTNEVLKVNQDMLVVDTSGNVGIGLTDPSGTRLVVNDDTSNNVLLVTNTKSFGEIGDICGSYPIAYFSVKQDPGLIFRGLEIGAPSGGVTAPVYLKVKGTSNRLGILNTSNTENMTILDNGNVGIGIINPTAKLHIISDQSGQSFNALNITNLTNNVSGVKTQINLPVFNGAEGGVIEEIGNSIDGYRLNIYQGQTSGQITFGTGGNNERMRITNNGNIGIGTTTPDWKMEVVGNESTLGISTTRYDTDGTLVGPAYFIGRSANGTESAPLDNSSVGVKIIGQGYRSGFQTLGEIDIYGSGNTGTGSGIKGNITFRTTSDNNAFSEKMTITSEGNVGIGTTTPTTTLDVSGNVNVSQQLYLPNITNSSQSNALYYNSSTGQVTYDTQLPITNYYKGTTINGTPFYIDDYIEIKYDTVSSVQGFYIIKKNAAVVYKIKGIAILQETSSNLININLQTTPYSLFNGSQQTGFFNVFSDDNNLPFYKIDTSSFLAGVNTYWYSVVQKFV